MKKAVINGTDQVDAYMKNLEHPLKAEIAVIRDILLHANKKIRERVKWNAPSFYYKQDMATFNPRAKNHVHIVFHHPSIESISSAILTGDYIGRRMVYLHNTEEVNSQKAELENIMNELVNIIDK
ncbi:DUF1801 domain-containing protein [Segetibacter sp. 3557_3]|uniref:DUF1801 domain-containing protein n=1 Tax=Segetibacter sp. 3557_3 TaxID=2547429 RepID=UPI0010589440|nr:DUF1801 domain-containing protein [Segetibacter sp. 3557_3]TDH21260.1 DUF1801 domain-containing protein [Segetibacter sp. 3557_3]